jgi:hypothetical protein
MRTSYRRSESGMSMVEVMIATVILGFIMFATYMILFSTSTTSARGQVATNLDAAGKEFIEFCKKEFYDARFNDNVNSQVLGIHDNNTQIHYQLALGMSDAGNVVYGYPAGANTLDNTGVTIQVKGVNQTLYKQNLLAWANYQAVVRFEPELVYCEGSSTTVLQPATADLKAPQTWRPNPYAGNVSLAPGTPLPVFSRATNVPLDLDMNRDGDKLDVFVKGKIWKYVMQPVLPLAATPVLQTYTVHSYVMVSDNVFLPVVGGVFRGDMEPAVTGAVIGSTVNLTDGKDWLFRYLRAEPSDPPTTYGYLDDSATLAFPGPNTVCLGITIWHGALDDTGKFFTLRKTWERAPFRLNRVSGP